MRLAGGLQPLPVSIFHPADPYARKEHARTRHDGIMRRLLPEIRIVNRTLEPVPPSHLDAPFGDRSVHLAYCHISHLVAFSVAQRRFVFNSTLNWCDFANETNRSANKDCDKQGT